MILEPQSIIDEIRKRGMELVAAGDKVRFRPQSAMTPELFQLLKLNKAGVLEILSNQNPEPRHPLADFDSSVFGEPPPWIQHKDPDCHSTDFWKHSSGGFYCSECWPCTDSIMQVEADDRPVQRPVSNNQAKPVTEWTAEEKQVVDWLDESYDRLIDETETFQHQIDIAGLILVLRRGPAAQGSKQAVSDLRILKRNPAEFHAEMAQRHERELNQWNPRYGGHR
ncbi:MAG: hypothetical protein IH899_01630 [Planctomycetes bacterium]|nr:hypothetical protein [Planctomycetota bacterium]